MNTFYYAIPFKSRQIVKDENEWANNIINLTNTCFSISRTHKKYNYEIFIVCNDELNIPFISTLPINVIKLMQEDSLEEIKKKWF